MLQDDRSGGEGRRGPSRNVFGEPLVACSMNPVTGFYRDGCCNTGLEDVGSHRHHCRVSRIFKIAWQRSLDAIAEPRLCRLKPGDRWCLCAPRWQEALEAGQAPRVVLRATHEAALSYCSLAELKRYAVDLA